MTQRLAFFEGFNSLVGLVDILNGEDGKVAVVSEVAEGDASTSLQAELVDGFL